MAHRRRNRVSGMLTPAGIAAPKEEEVDTRGVISIRLDDEEWTKQSPPKRFIIEWPEKLYGFTEGMTYDESRSVVGNLIGRIVVRKDETCSKTTPCNFTNAHLTLALVKTYETLKRRNGNSIYRTDLSDGFVSWFLDQKKQLRLSQEAHLLIDYDPSPEGLKALCARWDDAELVTEVHSGVKTSLIKFSDLSIPLYPWQASGMDALMALILMDKGAMLTDETGLGKTYTVMAVAKRTGNQVLIVCPAQLTEGWLRKIKHLIPKGKGPDRRVYVVEGTKVPLRAKQYDYIVVSYTKLREVGAWPLTSFVRDQSRLLFLDEGHYAKNYNSVRTSACLQLSQAAKASIILTATPLKNRIFELHPLLRIIRRLWTEMSHSDFIDAYTSEEGMEEIKDQLSRINVRRMFGEVWKDAPTGELGEAWVGLSNIEDYRKAEKDFIAFLLEAGTRAGLTKDQLVNKIASAERGKVIVQLNALRQLAADGKVKQTMPLVEKVLDAGEQCVVFCAFNGPLEAIAQRFSKKSGVNFRGQKWQGSGLITGKVTKKKRQQLIDDFQDGKVGCLCIGVTAGGLGIDLPIARFGFFLDLPWSPADLEQCTGRLVRLGQTRDCQFVKVLSPGTIDQRMEMYIHTKAKIFRATIGDEEAVNRVSSGNALSTSLMSELVSSFIDTPVLNAPKHKPALSVITDAL